MSATKRIQQLSAIQVTAAKDTYIRMIKAKNSDSETKKEIKEEDPSLLNNFLPDLYKDDLVRKDKSKLGKTKSKEINGVAISGRIYDFSISALIDEKGVVWCNEAEWEKEST